jgi:DNA primase large subunit
MTPLLDKHLPLHSNASRSSNLQAERRTDHYSHFILRLAFSSTEDLRRRFSRLETALFRLRYRLDDARERAAFTKDLGLGWEAVGERERAELAEELRAAGAGAARKAAVQEEDGYFKVDWERVPELVEARKVLLKRGVAYVPAREQISLVVPEFTKRLDEALEVRLLLLPLSANDPSPLPARSPASMKTTASPRSSRTFPAPSPRPKPPSTTPRSPRRCSPRPPTSTPSRSISRCACRTCTPSCAPTRTSSTLAACSTRSS